MGVRIEITNMNILGVQLELQDKSSKVKENFLGFFTRTRYNGDRHVFSLLPSETKYFDFPRFNYSPSLWNFALGAAKINESVYIKVVVYSTWVPGDSIDPSHPLKDRFTN